MPKDWDRHKAEIESLYITKGKPLTEVRRLLKGRHGFDASIRAYRMKLEEWDVRKNSPSRERRSHKRPFLRPPTTRAGTGPAFHARSAEIFPRAAEGGNLLGDASTILTSQSHDESHWSQASFNFPISDQSLTNYSFPASSELQNAENTPYLDGNNAMDFPHVSGKLSLHAAVLHGTEEEVNNLLSSGAPVSTRNSLENQPLHEAIIKGEISKIKLLLNYGADIDSAGFRGKTPLHLAASSQEVMNLLLKKRPAVSRQDQDGNTVLHLLLQLEDWWKIVDIKETIRSLLSSGADINLTNNSGESPLHLLVAQLVPRSSEMMEVLINFLDYNPNLSLPMPNGSLLFAALLRTFETILRYAGEVSWARGRLVDCTGLERKCLKRFLSMGASPDTVVKEGRRLLHYCLEEGAFLRRGSGELLMLIFQLADVNMAGSDGNQAFHHLLASNFSWYESDFAKLEYISVLIERNANVNQANTAGAFPLELLLSNVHNYIDCAIPILQAGATTMRLTSTGKSLFDLVNEKKITDTVRTSLTKAFLESDLAFQPELADFPHPPWAQEWRTACNEEQWIIAKHLVKFENSVSRPSREVLDNAFVVIAEHLLKHHKTQLVLWQGDRLDKAVAKNHRKEYLAILRDCRERRAAVEPSWYEYLLDIMDFEESSE